MNNNNKITIDKRMINCLRMKLVAVIIKIINLIKKLNLWIFFRNQEENL